MTELTSAATDEAFYGALVEDDAEELYQHAPCAYLSTLPDGTIAKVNETFVRWTGHAKADVIGHKRLQDLLPPGARIHYETHLAPLLRMQGQVREIAAEIICADQSRLPVVLGAVAKMDEQGEAVTYRVALFDATERRSYEQELLAARRRAEESEARAKALAATLQQSFLPPELLEIAGFDVAGAYRPAGDGTEVGGDFYDVFETGRGTWGIVLGDVSGKGATAAPVTALARYAVRNESLRTPYPSAVLNVAHDAIRRTYPDRLCTALLLFLERHDGGHRIVISSGGHHLPILLREGRLTRVGITGTALGLLDVAELRDAYVPLQPGDVVVLHTDGVTEARNGDAFLEDEGLEAIIEERPPESASELADRIVERTLDFQDGNPRDDIAVVVLRVPG